MICTLSSFSLPQATAGQDSVVVSGSESPYACSVDYLQCVTSGTARVSSCLDAVTDTLEETLSHPLCCHPHPPLFLLPSSSFPFFLPPPLSSLPPPLSSLPPPLFLLPSSSSPLSPPFFLLSPPLFLFLPSFSSSLLPPPLFLLPSSSSSPLPPPLFLLLPSSCSASGC